MRLGVLIAPLLAVVGVLAMPLVIASATPNVSIDARSTCSTSSTCTSFIVTMTNFGTSTINGVSVEILGGAVSTLQLNSYLTDLCKAKSAHRAFVCFPITLAPSTTLRAMGISSAPLSSATQFRLYTTVNGFSTSTGETVPLASGPGYPLTTSVVVGRSHSGAAILVGIGITILIIGAGAIGAVAVARRRRRPVKCAAQIESLKNAETALRYWETAIQTVQRDHAALPGDARLADALLKSHEGHATAMDFRDRCQLEVMQCMTSN
jgi:hypothetical protein